MMIFIPPGINSTCDGIEFYQESRPNLDPQIQQANLGLFVFLSFLWSISLIWCYFERKDPRLRARPFSLSASLVICHILFYVGACLNLAINTLPCSILLFSFLFGLGGFAANFYVRVLVFIVESQFAQQVAEYTLNFDENTSNSSGSLINNINMNNISWFDSPSSHCSSIITLFKFALRLNEIEKISMPTLLRAKNAYGSIAFIVFLPCLIPFVIILIVVPQYDVCVNCPIFLEIPISFLCALVVYVVFSLRVCYIAWKMKYPDMYGIFAELLVILFVISPIAFLSWILLIVDPGNVEYSRKFAWEYLTVINGLIYWINSFGFQMFKIYQFRCKRKKAASIGPANLEELLRAINESEEIKQNFEKYCVSLYAIENLHFVLDVATYIEFFREKGPSWRRQKAKLLYETYIKTGGVMEINISYETKRVLIEQYDAGFRSETAKELESVFLEACLDITSHVLLGIWNTFYITFKKKRRQQSVFGSFAVSNV